MSTVFLVIHLLIALALVLIVLLQRSEGGALGIGGGGGFMTGRGMGDALTRTTAVLALCFFATSIILTLMARGAGPVLDSISGEELPEGFSTPAPAPLPEAPPAIAVEPPPITLEIPPPSPPSPTP